MGGGGGIFSSLWTKSSASWKLDDLPRVCLTSRVCYPRLSPTVLTSPPTKCFFPLLRTISPPPPPPSLQSPIPLSYHHHLPQPALSITKQSTNSQAQFHNTPVQFTLITFHILRVAAFSDKILTRLQIAIILIYWLMIFVKALNPILSGFLWPWRCS